MVGSRRVLVGVIVHCAVIGGGLPCHCQSHCAWSAMGGEIGCMEREWWEIAVLLSQSLCIVRERWEIGCPGAVRRKSYRGM